MGVEKAQKYAGADIYSDASATVYNGFTQNIQQDSSSQQAGSIVPKES